MIQVTDLLRLVLVEATSTGAYDILVICLYLLKWRIMQRSFLCYLHGLAVA